MSLEEIQACDLLEMARDKVQSRQLQRNLLRGSPEVVQLIFKKAELVFMDLVRDQYGNYLSQRILEVCDAEQFDSLFRLLRDHLRDLALDVHGTRAVQKIVEVATSRGKIPELLDALPGELAVGFAQNFTGFHVVVKLIESLPAKDAEDILERLCGTPEKALTLGKDQWGCCVLKKCIDRTEGDMRQKVTEAITQNTLLLVQDPFGNYVVQHLILFSHLKPNPYITPIVDALKGNIFELSQQKFSSNVLEKCLVNSTDKDRNKIINEILNPPCCQPSEGVRVLLFHQFGNYVFQQALEVSKDPQFSLLIQLCKQPVQDMAQREEEPDTPQIPGNLAGEHARRLAMKLVKKYPPLAAGLEMGPGSIGYNWCYDAYGSAFGMYPQAWPGAATPFDSLDPALVAAMYGYTGDPNFNPYQQFAYPPLKGRKGGKGGGGRGGGGKQRRKSQGAGKRGTSATAKGTPSGANAAYGESSAVKVGRITGFWPHYSVTYDDVPDDVPSPATGGGKAARSKNKAKGKAAPPVDPAFVTEPSA
jgi:hypothetical protein